jgi:hypothetical protein
MNGDDVLPSARLRELARLAPSHRDPEHYHLVKSGLVSDLRSLAADLDGHRPVISHVKHGDQLRLSVITVPPGVGRLPPLATNCLHCRRRRASQGRGQRLKLPGMTLFDWADRAGVLTIKVNRPV